MSIRSATAWGLAVPVMLLCLLGPALWNGFPLIFPDTGGYLARPFEHTLTIGRSAFYGAFLAAGLPWRFWPNVLIQAALCIWLVVLVLRVHGVGGRPFAALVLVLGLSACTSLPWFSSQLVPDILFPLAVLGLYLLAFHGGGLRWAERAVLAIVCAAAVASHMALLGLAGLLLLALTGWRLLAPKAGLRPTLGPPSFAVAAGVGLALLSNFVIAGEFALTPGGETFLFGRLVQQGIIGRYLAEHCPDASPQLCPYRNHLPNGDEWLWSNDSPLHKLGGWRAFAREERRIILATLLLYPDAHLAGAIAGTLDQLRTTRTKASTNRFDNDDALTTIERLAPRSASALREARQQTGRLEIGWLNAIHLPVAALSTAGLILLVELARRRKAHRDTAALAATILLALLFNAAICGVFSGSSNRYESRLIWLAPFCAAVAVLRRRADRSAHVLAQLRA